MTTPQDMKKLEQENNPKMSESAHKRSGIRSTEFWLAVVTSGLSLAILGGWIDLEGSTTADKIAAMIAMALSSMGYTVGRSIVKGKSAASEGGENE